MNARKKYQMRPRWSIVALTWLGCGVASAADSSVTVTNAQLAALMEKTKVALDFTPTNQFVENPDPNTMQVRLLAKGSNEQGGCSVDGKVLRIPDGTSDDQEQKSITDCFKVRLAYLIATGKTIPPR